MAEGERFELSTLITQGKSLAGARTRPLCDPSIWHSILYHKSLCSSKGLGEFGRSRNRNRFTKTSGHSDKQSRPIGIYTLRQVFNIFNEVSVSLRVHKVVKFSGFRKLDDYQPSSVIRVVYHRFEYLALLYQGV